MFSDEPMPADMLGVLWPMADEPGWTRKWAIVSWVGSFPEGTFVEGQDLALMLGIAAGRARMHLKELAQARILDRDGADGGRKFWYRLNPSWWQWDISWRYDRRQIEMRLAYWAETRAIPPLMLLSARSYGARYTRISARLMARANADEEAQNVSVARAIGPRAMRAGQGASARHGARATEPGTRAKDRALNRPRSGESNSSPRVLTLVTNDSLTAPPEEEDKGSTNTVTDQQVTAVWRSFRERCVPGRGRARPALWGAPKTLLRDLIAEHGPVPVVEAADRLPAGQFVPKVFVEQLVDELSDGPDAPPDPTAERQRLEAKLAGLKQHIANHEANGWPVPDELAEELAELRRQLDATG